MNSQVYIPIIAAIIASSLTYILTLRVRKYELLQINKIAAFKDVSTALSKLKRHCLGCVAMLESNELSPFSSDEYSIFECRRMLTIALDENLIFLSLNSRTELENLINNLSIVANAELSQDIANDFPGIKESYLQLSESVSSFIQRLYEDLNLKS